MLGWLFGASLILGALLFWKIGATAGIAAAVVGSVLSALAIGRLNQWLKAPVLNVTLARTEKGLGVEVARKSGTAADVWIHVLSASGILNIHDEQRFEGSYESEKKDLPDQAESSASFILIEHNGKVISGRGHELSELKLFWRSGTDGIGSQSKMCRPGSAIEIRFQVISKPGQRGRVPIYCLKGTVEWRNGLPQWWNDSLGRFP